MPGVQDSALVITVSNSGAWGSTMRYDLSGILRSELTKLLEAEQ